MVDLIFNHKDHLGNVIPVSEYHCIIFFLLEEISELQKRINSWDDTMKRGKDLITRAELSEIGWLVKMAELGIIKSENE
jgi:hypothetical protein